MGIGGKISVTTRRGEIKPKARGTPKTPPAAPMGGEGPALPDHTPARGTSTPLPDDRGRVEREEAACAEHALHLAPERPQREHVEREVLDVRVQERGRDDLPGVEPDDPHPRRPIAPERPQRIRPDDRTTSLCLEQE